MLYSHYKNGVVYETISEHALLENTKERAVVYRPVDAKHGEQVWVRAYSDFHALIETYPTRTGPAQFVPRFKAVAPVSKPWTTCFLEE